MSQRLDLQYYEILGVNTSASMDEIEAAYQRARKIYSEYNPEFKSSFDNSEATELMTWLEEAYQELSRKLKNQNQFQPQFNELPIAAEVKAPAYQFEAEQDFSEYTDAFEDLIDPQLEDKLFKASFYDGLLLKKVRLKQNISLNYISSKTCIGVHHLIAIEANDFKALPAAVFVRSYVKQIAQILGLVSKDVSESYMRLYIEACGDD